MDKLSEARPKDIFRVSEICSCLTGLFLSCKSLPVMFFLVDAMFFFPLTFSALSVGHTEFLGVVDYLNDAAGCKVTIITENRFFSVCSHQLKDWLGFPYLTEDIEVTVDETGQRIMVRHRPQIPPSSR